MPLQSSAGFGDAAYAYVDVGDAVPGGVIYNSGLGKVEDSLESFYCFGGGRSVDSICGDGGNRRVVLGYAVQLLLDLSYFLTGGAYVQVIAWERRGHTGNALGCVDIHIAPVIIVDDINCRIAFFSEVFGAPLA